MGFNSGFKGLKKQNLKFIQLSQEMVQCWLLGTKFSGFGDHVSFFVSSTTIIFAIRTLLH